jgi:DNA replication protein DnaC
MLTQPTVERLHTLGLVGMAQALAEQLQSDSDELTFLERLGLLVDREQTERENRRLKTRLAQAHLRQTATVEDVNLKLPRGLDKALFRSLSSCQWVAKHHNLLITGKTGVGKSYLACALAQKACRDGYRVLYVRVTRLLSELGLAKGDGRYPKLLASLARTDLLVLDDWGLQPFSDGQRRDLLEILDDRYDRRSTLVTSQLPVDSWHDAIGDPTLADAVLDRLIHNAYRLPLTGESVRKRRGLTESEEVAL